MIENDSDAFAELLSSSNHSQTFVATAIDRVKSDINLCKLCDQACDKNHVLFPLIASKLFKCFIKNLLKKRNAPKTKNQGSDRKLRKLDSKTAKM